jgi:hypothetical protein
MYNNYVAMHSFWADTTNMDNLRGGDATGKATPGAMEGSSTGTAVTGFGNTVHTYSGDDNSAWSPCSFTLACLKGEWDFGAVPDAFTIGDAGVLDWHDEAYHGYYLNFGNVQITTTATCGTYEWHFPTNNNWLASYAGSDRVQPVTCSDCNTCQTFGWTSTKRTTR